MQETHLVCHLGIYASNLVRCQQFVCPSGLKVNWSSCLYDNDQLWQEEELGVEKDGSQVWVEISAEQEHEYDQWYDGSTRHPFHCQELWPEVTVVLTNEDTSFMRKYLSSLCLL